MLEALGLNSLDEKTYRLVLRHPTWSGKQVASKLEIPQDLVDDSMERLERRGLIRRGVGGSEVVPLDPDDVLQELVAEAELETARRRRQAAAIRRQISPLLSEYLRQQQSATHLDQADRLPVPEKANVFLAELVRIARSSVQLLYPVTSPDADTIRSCLPHEVKALRRGVRIQAVYSVGTASEMTRWQHARRLTDEGGEVRITANVPLRLVLVDRVVAVIPEGAQAAAGGAMLVLRGEGLTDALAAVFDHCWDASRPMPSTDRPDLADLDDEALSDPERDLLYLLSLGMKDDAIARQIGVSVRTVRRLVSQLLQRLEATSRFQAGVRAADRGWVARREPS